MGDNIHVSEIFTRRANVQQQESDFLGRDSISQIALYLCYYFAKYGHDKAFDHAFRNLPLNRMNEHAAHEICGNMEKLPYYYVPVFVDRFITIPKAMNDFAEGFVSYGDDSKREDDISRYDGHINELLQLKGSFKSINQINGANYESDAIIFLSETGFFPENVGIDEQDRVEYLKSGFKNFAETLRVYQKLGGRIDGDDLRSIQGLGLDLKSKDCVVTGIEREKLEMFIQTAQQMANDQNSLIHKLEL